MTLQIPTEQLQEEVLNFLKYKMGDAWNNLPQEQRDLVIRVAINYGKEHVKLVVAELFKGTDAGEARANIAQLKAQLLALGIALQAKIIEALNEAITNAIQTLFDHIISGNTPSK
jgi:hypothetical protein